VHVHGCEPVPWPHKVGVIPREAEAFQERAAAEHLRTTLADGATAVPCQVLCGTGGVGKTQLAAHYARTAWQAGELDLLVWISASSRPAIISAYAQAADELLAVESGDPERAAKRFLALLDKPREDPVCRWLVVLDDVTDPADLKELYPPESPHGRTLVTTRRRDAALPGQRVNLGMFTPEQATAYVTKSLVRHGRQDDMSQIRALAEDLGYLPLALSQAVAYLIDTGLNCRAYRELLADRTARLDDLEPDALPDDQAHAVRAAWSLSIEHANRLRPTGMARPMLQLAAILDPNGIPHDVLISQPALDHLTVSASPTSGPAAVRDAERALSVLHRLSLIDHTPHQTVRIHQLIQRTVREAHPEKQRDHLAHIAADALIAVWPEIERDTALTQALRANTTALANHVGDDALYRSAAQAVLYRAGTSLGDAGQVAAARDHFARLTAAAHRRLGPDHPDTLTARHHLASMQGQAGDPAGAVAAFAQLLDDRVRVLGPDHPDTLSTRHHLATTRGQAGDRAGAANALQSILEYLLKAKGRVHPDTLHIRYLLAYWQGEADDLEASLASFPQVIADLRQVLGPEHTDTLTARGDFAAMQGQAGDAAGAVANLAELVDDMMRVLGPDHPYTLIARMNLASMQGQAGDAARAVASLAELLDDMARVLGPDHPATLYARLNLALGRGQTGDEPGVVVTALVALLADQVRVLGPYHPDTFATRHNLAACRGEAGDAAGAVAAYEELLSDQLRELGPDHPETATIREHLTYWNERVAEGDAHQSTD
jgi:hypothetical protein